MKVSFLGLGIMGSRMAQNLLKNNVSLTVYNRSEAIAQALEKQGATRATSAAEAVQDADIIFSMLASPEAVAAVITNEGAALDHMKPNALWVDCSTVNPSFSKASAEAAQKRGIRFLDAPVAGTKPHAQNAELVFFVGGAESDLQEAQPLMEHMGRKVMHIGPMGMGASFKMLVNSMLAQAMIVFSETLLLGEKMGLEADFLLNTLPNLVVAAPFTKAKAEMIRSNDFGVQFPLELMHKDLHLVTTTAYEVGQPLPMANAAKEVYADAKRQGLAREDFAAVHKALKKE